MKWAKKINYNQLTPNVIQSVAKNLDNINVNDTGILRYALNDKLVLTIIIFFFYIFREPSMLHAIFRKLLHEQEPMVNGVCSRTYP